MWIGGLDLGQSQDPSALALLERSQTPEGQSNYSVRYLKRWPLGTPYVSPPDHPPGIGEDLRAMLDRPYLHNCPLAVDQTGVGRGVIDAFRLLELPVPLVPITITGGQKATMEPDGSWHVPKRELVACLQVLLGQGRLVVAEALPLASVLVQEMRTFKYKVTLAGNEQYECLTAGTLVTTSDGEKPIESVKQDDDVLTRGGYNRVVWAGETKRVSETCRVEFENGTSLEGTPDHLVWTETRGWVAMESLTCQDLCILAPKTSARASLPKSSSSTASNTGSRQDTPITTIGESRTPCTERSGSSTTDPSRQDTTSITSTRTRRTTTSATSSCLPTPSTLVSTSNATRPKRRNARSAARGLSADVAAQPGSRTRARPSARFGVPYTDVLSGSLLASNVASSSSPTDMAVTAILASALLSAARLIGIATGPIRRSHAQDAGPTFCPSTGSPSFVRVAASPSIVARARPLPVYDLVVEGRHEFYANGILVHNSWRDRDHDDTVLAVAIAAWLAERMPPFDADSIGTGSGHSPLADMPAGVFGTGDPRRWPGRF